MVCSFADVWLPPGTVKGCLRLDLMHMRRRSVGEYREYV